MFPERIRIRPNDTDPTGSRSEILFISLECDNECLEHSSNIILKQEGKKEILPKIMMPINTISLHMI